MVGPMLLLEVFVIASLLHFSIQSDVDLKCSKIWGPGLKPHVITMPARYFFVKAVNCNSSISINSTLIESQFEIAVEGTNKKQQPNCRIWTNVLDRKDGSFIVRYKVYEICSSLVISVKHEGIHVGESPYLIKQNVYPEDCKCTNRNLESMLDNWSCKPIPEQLEKDLSLFEKVDWNAIRNKVIKTFDNPGAISLCHYIIKDTEIYNKCYGKYVGFKMFIDSMLLSLSKKASLPDLEFFVNLGDWPLVSKMVEMFPIFSWCGSTDSYDIVMPTYDISESSLENMGKVMLDMLSVQGNVKDIWKNRIPKLFWRGRDSNKHRLKLIDIGRRYPDLFNVSLTNFFFFRDLEDQYGPKSDHVSFFDFFNYKYQLSIDGTVAAYRMPYLLAGGSLLFKPESKYYEHFYNQLIPNVHYVSVKTDLSDLVEKIQWAKDNDEKAQEIAKNGRIFANEHLLPQNVFCYYAFLLHEFSKKIVSEIKVLDGMEKVESNDKPCDCTTKDVKEEL